MKFAILALILLSACSTMTKGKYKKEFYLEDYPTAKAPSDLHKLLTEKMTKCYPQSEYPVYEKTVSSFDAAKDAGTVYYEIDNQSIGPKILVLVEVEKTDSGSVAKVYSKGDLLRTPNSFKHQIHKWIDGKKVDCDGQGQI
jgi:hypothetical protein